MEKLTGDERILLLGVLGILLFVVVGAIAWLFGTADEASELETSGDRSVLSLEVVGRLPDVVREGSGIAVSRNDSTLLWTHNDGTDGRVFLMRRSGELVGVVRMVGESVNDVEDIAVGPCPEELTAPFCLYLADTGDNSRNRDSYAILVAPDPEAESWGAGSTQELDVEFRALRFGYPDGSYDAEAFTLTPTGGMLVITKGQEGSAHAFRIVADGEAVPLGALPIDVSNEALRPTGAALSPSGSSIAVGSNEAIFLFSAEDLSVILHRCDLPVGRQREAVDFISDSLLIVSSEGSGTPIELVRCP
jgi:hypothetical protein